MSDKTGIEWTDATWNPLRGTKGSWFCTKVSPACVHCYAERMNVRFGGPKYVAGADQIRLGPTDLLNQPIRWRKRRMIFVCSMTDLFHETVSREMLDSIFGVMAACRFGRDGTPGHTFQVLTKRPGLMRNYLSQDRRRFWARWATHFGGGKDPDSLHDMILYGPRIQPNIWLGVSAETQEYADERIPILLDTPAAVRFISAEPLLGEMNLRRFFAHSVHCHKGHNMGDPVCRCQRIGWLIAGGESGPHASPTHPEWVRGLRDQCGTAKIPFFFKQWGEWTLDHTTQIKVSRHRYVPKSIRFRTDGATYNPLEPDTLFEDGMISMYRVGKRKAGRLLDGVLYDEIPEGDTTDRGFIVKHLPR